MVQFTQRGYMHTKLRHVAEHQTLSCTIKVSIFSLIDNNIIIVSASTLAVCVVRVHIQSILYYRRCLCINEKILFSIII